ncbi:MAG: hypothetical protein OXI86_08000 [Candidatus Poribacteria bacterium]|nr:hypothetical protein [Candidatus Poribacteria bacterium]
MTKIPFLFIVLWFCTQLTLPYSVPAQSVTPQPTEDSAEKTQLFDTPEEKPTNAAEPDNQPSGSVDNVEVNQQVVQIGGNYHLNPKEAVESLVAIGGNLTLRGKVSNDVLVLKGDVEVQKGAEVLGSVTTVLGKIRGKQYLEGMHREVNGWRFIPASAWLIMRPQEAWGMGKSAKFVWGVSVFIALTLVHITVYAVFSQRMNAMAHVISHRPIGSTLLGVVVLIAAPCLIAVLVLSIIGIPFVLLFISALLPIAIYGKTAIFLSMGQTIFSNQPKVVAVIAGYWIYFMATSIPHVGLPMFLAANTIAVGICFRTVFGQKFGQSAPPFAHRNPLLDKYPQAD